MHKRQVISTGYWQDVRKLAKNVSQRKAAIAFVTENLIGFDKGDLLVTNASLASIRRGQTKARLLLKLHDAGVSIYNCPDLHGKILLLDDTAVIGSGNMSDKSNRPAGGWKEVGFITNDPVAVAGVTSIIEQLIRPKDAFLKREKLEALTKIKVTRKGGWGGGKKKNRRVARLGNETWIVGVSPVASTAEEDKQDKKVQAQFGYEASWVRPTASSRMAKEARPGDQMIVIFNQPSEPTMVCRAVPILFRGTIKHRAYFYYKEPNGRHAEIPWAKFTKLAGQVGHGSIKQKSTRLLKPDVADALRDGWKAIATS